MEKKLKERLHCRVCDEYKEREFFPLNKSHSKNSRKSICKDCQKIRVNRYRRETVRGRYYVYTKNARLRKLAFSISVDTLSVLVSSKCHYCGINSPTMGVDRIDSSIGYEVGNVLPCCSTCNKMKSAHGYEEFTKIISRIFKNLNLS